LYRPTSETRPIRRVRQGNSLIGEDIGFGEMESG
jgi:hypothetical protein